MKYQILWKAPKTGATWRSQASWEREEAERQAKLCSKHNSDPEHRQVVGVVPEEAKA